MDLITIAITVSRVEAVVVAAMLEGYGIQVHIGANAQASVEANSLALGGHRLWIAAADWNAASDILRQSAATAPGRTSLGPRRAIFRFWGASLAIHTVILLPWAVIIGVFPAHLAAVLLNLMVIPVAPQGRADYYLAPLATE
ncbi:MAG: hypothetical protein NWP98_04890 [Erythrobacter sp.]|nr:hypothetical protein [Erythrobacter sp.]